MSTFRIRVDGQVNEGEADSDTSLFAALTRAGIAWPVSCRNGTCRTCIGQLVSGSVRYEIEWPGVTREERAEGCVLPCIAYPEGDVVLQDPGP